MTAVLSAPFAISNSTMALCPWMAAMWRGVMPPRVSRVLAWIRGWEVRHARASSRKLPVAAQMSGMVADDIRVPVLFVELERVLPMLMAAFEAVVPPSVQVRSHSPAYGLIMEAR